MARTGRWTVGAAWGLLAGLVTADIAGIMNRDTAQPLRGLCVAIAVTTTLANSIREMSSVLERQTDVLSQMRAESIEMFTMGRTFEAGAVLPLPPRRTPKAFPRPDADDTEGSVVWLPGAHP